MINYKAGIKGIEKDGHTMFQSDIVRELNRKAYIESKIEPVSVRDKLVDELRFLLSNRSSSLSTCDRYTAQYLIDFGYRKI